MFRTSLITAVAAVALAAAQPTFAQPNLTQPNLAQAAVPAQAGNVIDVLKADGRFTVLLDAIEAAHLTQTLKSQSAVSIFAPTDAAFAKLPDAERAELMDPANVDELRQVLLYHVIVADVASGQIVGTRGGVETAAGIPAQLDGTGGVIKIDDATVTTADIHAANGAIFVIDTVLTPAAVVDPDAEAPPVIPDRTPPLEQDPDDEDTSPMTAPAPPPAPMPELPD